MQISEFVIMWRFICYRKKFLPRKVHHVEHIHSNCFQFHFFGVREHLRVVNTYKIFMKHIKEESILFPLTIT